MILRWTGFALLVLVLLACAYNGVTEGISAVVRSGMTVGTWTVTVAQWIYGASSILALIAIALRNPFATQCLQGWSFGTIVASGVAPVAYGGASIWAGFASAAAGGLIAGIILWIWKNRPPVIRG